MDAEEAATSVCYQGLRPQLSFSLPTPSMSSLVSSTSTPSNHQLQPDDVFSYVHEGCLRTVVADRINAKEALVMLSSLRP